MSACIRLLLAPLCFLPFLHAEETGEARTARIAANRAWYQALPAAPAPELTRHGLVATELDRWPVRGANQGVAVDAEHFYGIGNFVIVKHRKDTGAPVAEWLSPKGGPIVHFNGGHVTDGRLVIAHSNFAQLPMASSLETFDAAALAPVATHSFGIRLGSLTWAERRDGFWWACFANYNDQGTTPGFDQRWTYVGKFDDRWQLLESWLFPPQVIATWGRSACSGGSWGDDGLLYVTGHDARELNVLRLPKMGVVLDYVTTIDVPFEGQSWAWDRTATDDRVIYGISRSRYEVVRANSRHPAGAPQAVKPLFPTGFEAIHAALFPRLGINRNATTGTVATVGPHHQIGDAALPVTAPHNSGAATTTPLASAR